MLERFYVNTDYNLINGLISEVLRACVLQPFHGLHHLARGPDNQRY